MDGNLEEKKKMLERAIEALPPRKQDAVRWMFRHYDTFAQMCKEEPLTPSEREEMMRESIRRDDVYMQVLLILEKILNRDV